MSQILSVNEATTPTEPLMNLKGEKLTPSVRSISGKPKVLMVTPPNNMAHILGSGKVFADYMEPEGLLSIVTYLRTRNIDARFYDGYLEHDTIDEFKEYLTKQDFNIIGISAVTANGAMTYELGRWLKETFPEKIVILGNIHPAIFWKFYLENNTCDYVSHGEGEMVLEQFFEALDGKRDMSEVAGLSWKPTEVEAVKNKAFQPFMKLDDIPYSDPELYDIERYKGTYSSKKRFNVFTSRGCVFRCRFCAVHQNGFRYKSADNILRHLDHLIEEHGANYFIFVDSLFIANRKRLVDFCQKVIKGNYKFKWFCEGHVKMVNDEVLGMMKEAGCREIAYGIESGVQRVLDKIGKGSTLELIDKATELTHKHKILIHGLFVLGFPTETKEEILRTIDYSLELPLDIAQFSIFTPYPGTEFYDELLKQGKLKGFDPATIEGHTHYWDQFSAYPAFTQREPVYTPDDMTSEWLVNMQRKAFRRFYMRPKQFMNQMKRINLFEWEKYYSAIRALFMNARSSRKNWPQGTQVVEN